MAGRKAVVRFYDHGATDGSSLGRWFSIGDDVPAEVVKRLGAPAALFGDVGDVVEQAPGSDPDPTPAVSVTNVYNAPGSDAPVEDLGTVEVPPKGGPGSGKDAWAAYAASQGVKTDAGANRDDIILDLEAAGVPTE